MTTFFNVVINNICDMVEKVMDDIQTSAQPILPSKILLVGGLGSSEYVHQQLESLVAHRRWTVEIVRPRIGAAAVVQGVPSSCWVTLSMRHFFDAVTIQ
jgi:hypothetical protein